MLAKLLKYDFKSMFKLFLPLWGALLVVSAVNRLISGAGLDAEQGLGLVNSIMVLLYILLIVAVLVVTTVIIIARFYQGLLKDEGYLMFTIPVHPWQLITSKLISAVVVSLLSGVVAVASVFIIASYGGMFQDLFWIWGQLMRVAPDVNALTALMLAAIFVGIICSVTQVYAAMALGHLAGRHRVGFSVLAYIVLGVIWSTVDSVLGQLGYPGSSSSLVINLAEVSITDATALVQTIMTALVWSMIIDVIRCVVHFIVANYILSRKLNLE